MVTLPDTKWMESLDKKAEDHTGVDHRVKRAYYYYKLTFVAKLLDRGEPPVVVGGIFRLYERLTDDEDRLRDLVDQIVDSEIFADDADTHGTMFIHENMGHYKLAGSYSDMDNLEGQWSIHIEPLYTFENEIGEDEGHISVTYHE